MNPLLRHSADDAFANAFGGTPGHWFSAPGRVNLIGEHTDYNDGFVLSCAIDRTTMIAARPLPEARIVTVSADHDEVDTFALDAPIERSGKTWANYVRGVAAMLSADGHRLSGAQLAIAGDLPQGAGLSSSASLEVAVADTLATLSGLELDATELARIGQRAENEFVGCACGIMDQLVAARGKAGHALLIDCRTLAIRPIALPGDCAIVIAHSGISRANTDGAYNDRRRQCEEAARHFGVAALRDLDHRGLERDAAGLDPLLLRRARHVVTENARVLATAEALESGDLAAVGRLMAASHASMRNDFEITVPEIDRLAALMAQVLDQVGGARMTGAGFGGCVVAFAPAAFVDRLLMRVRSDYRTPDGEQATLFVVMADDGVRPYP